MTPRFVIACAAIAFSANSVICPFASAATFGSPALPRTVVDQAFQITFIDTAHPAPSAGYVSSWEVYSAAASTAALQIWRPVGSNYQLVGENAVSTTGSGVVDFPIALPDQIAIQPGDLLGFRYGYSARADRMITFDYGTGGTFYTLDWPNPAEDVAVGGTLPQLAFGSNDPGSAGRTYSLSATISVPEPTVGVAGTAAAAGMLSRRRRQR